MRHVRRSVLGVSLSVTLVASVASCADPAHEDPPRPSVEVDLPPTPTIPTSTPWQRRLVIETTVEPTPEPDVVESPKIVHRVSICPTPYPIVSSFGMRWHPVYNVRIFHNGVDIATPIGTKVRAPYPGVVKQVRRSDTGGLMLTIDHLNGRTTSFLHLSAVKVTKGDKVRTGETIAYTGATGRVTGPHLHLEHTMCGEVVDPTFLASKVLQREQRNEL